MNYTLINNAVKLAIALEHYKDGVRKLVKISQLAGMVASMNKEERKRYDERMK